MVAPGLEASARELADLGVQVGFDAVADGRFAPIPTPQEGG
jgi:hypothetical protein